MKPSAWLLSLLAMPFALAEQRLASVYLQPITRPSKPPVLLATVAYDTQDPSHADITSFEAPEIPPGASLARVGVYDPAAARWLSSTSVTALDNFGKGYSPVLSLSVDAAGAALLGVSCRGVRIDAGQTRDFGPQAVVVVAEKGRQPELNKPVVLSPEGKKVAEPEEKSLLQR
jgi:hypothetical protein